jgi:glycosyltransferase involved in cell wall biosynthesis
MTSAGQELSRRGHDVSIVCRRAEPGLPERERLSWGATVLRHSDPQIRGGQWVIEPLLMGRHLRRVIPRLMNGTDVVIARNPLYAFATATARPEVPMVYVMPSLASREIAANAFGSGVKARAYRRLKVWQYRYLERIAVRRARWVVTFSEIRKRETVDAYRIPETRVRVIPPGIPHAEPNGRVAARRLREDLELPEDAKVVLTACRLVERKNLPLLIQAVARIQRDGVYLVIAGDGPERPALETLVARLGLAGRVRFAGFQREMAALYALSDVFVLPSTYEPFGFVYLEAMAAGVPCIGLRAEYPRVLVATEEIIEDGITGFCVPPSDVSLQGALEGILWDPGLRKRMGQAAMQHVRQRYSWTRHVDELLRLVQV